MTEVHDTKNYKVFLVPVVDVEKDFPYHVVSKIHEGVVEYRAENLPQAKIICEQFNDMVENNEHLKYRQNFQVGEADNVEQLHS